MRVRITEEELKALSQLDRIEFRQKVDNLDKNNQLALFTYCYQMFGVLGFMFIFDMWMSIHRGYWVVPIETYLLLAKLIGIGAALLFLLDIIGLALDSKRRKKLFDEYFKVKLEVKKNGAKTKTKE